MNQEKMKAKGIFLDLDGTLVDSRQAYIEAARIAFESLGKELPDENVALEIPRRLEKSQPISDIINVDVQRFLAAYFHGFYLVAPQKTRLFPKVSITLRLLARKAKLALVTMRYVPKLDIRKELDYFGISEHFSYVVTALDTVKPKPSPEALLECVKALDVDVCDCIIAGDSVNDVRAGKAAGVRTVALLSGIFWCEELAKESPDLILADVTELPNYVE